MKTKLFYGIFIVLSMWGLYSCKQAEKPIKFAIVSDLHAPDLPDLGYNGRGRGSHDHQRQFPLDADGCGDLLGNGLLDDLGGHHPACFLLEDIRE